MRRPLRSYTTSGSEYKWVHKGVTHYAIELLDAPGSILNSSHTDETKAARTVSLNGNYVNFYIRILELQNALSGRKRW